jgi:hypothetical protein
VEPDTTSDSLEIAFPGNRFSGKILPELQRLLDAGTISIVDGLFLRKDENGEVTFIEVDEVGTDEGVAELAALFDRFDEMISDEDIEELSAALDPNSSAAVLVFEHTWVRPLATRSSKSAVYSLRTSGSRPKSWPK